MPFVPSVLPSDYLEYVFKYWPSLSSSSVIFSTHPIVIEGRERERDGMKGKRKKFLKDYFENLDTDEYHVR